MHYAGNTSLIKKHLGFLETEYNFTFAFQTFDDYYGFCGPIDAYSFYNDSGCFTIHNIVQRGEWGWFTSKKFSANQYELLEAEIVQTNYITKRHWFYNAVLKELANIIKKQIDSSGSFFNIRIGIS